MTKYIVLFLFTAVVTANAQVPGYIGMKNSFGYEPNFSVAASFVNSQFRGLNFGEGGGGHRTNGFFGLNVSHTFVYDRIIKRNASFNASFSFFKSGIDLADYSYETEDQFYQFTTYTYLGGMTKISGFAINLAYRKYKNDLAPLGMYYGYFGGFGSSSAMIHNSASNPASLEKVHVMNPKFGYQYGRQNVFFDKVIVDRGFQLDLLSFMLGFISRNKQGDQNGTGYGVTTSAPDHFQREIKTRMYYRDCITFYIGGKYMF